MDLSGKVAALEEEVTVLKGEIKLILQEVRIAILARENPFTVASTESLALPASLREERGPSTDRGAAAPILVEAPAVAEPEAPTPLPVPIAKAAPKAAPRVEPEPFEPARMNVPKLAALVSWTQETATRHSSADLCIVLSLARYGGLIEADLENTLAEIGKSVNETSTTRAGIGDLLLALRQLEAILGPDIHSTDAAGR